MNVFLYLQPLLAITSVLSGLSMIALASWFVTREYGANSLNWIPIMTLCLCIFCDSSGLQPISIVIASEIFSFKVSVSAINYGTPMRDFISSTESVSKLRCIIIQ